MLETLGSIVLGLISIAALYLIAHHRPQAGWAVNFTVQVPMIAYNVWTGQYGFLVLCLFTMMVSVKSFHKVRSAR